jgi:hypothetical protein
VRQLLLLGKFSVQGLARSLPDGRLPTCESSQPAARYIYWKKVDARGRIHNSRSSKLMGVFGAVPRLLLATIVCYGSCHSVFAKK